MLIHRSIAMESISLQASRYSSFLHLLFITLFSLLAYPSLASSPIPLQKPLQPPQTQTIVFYLHGIANVSFFNLLRPATSTSNVGMMNVGNEVLTEGPSLSSKRVGTFFGLDVETGTGRPSSSVMIPSTIKYDDGVYKGSIVQQGELDLNAETSELAVLGGTGDFLGVKGYSVRKFISNTKVGDITDIVVQFTVHLFYRKA